MSKMIRRQNRTKVGERDNQKENWYKRNFHFENYIHAIQIILTREIKKDYMTNNKLKIRFKYTCSFFFANIVYFNFSHCNILLDFIMQVVNYRVLSLMFTINNYKKHKRGKQISNWVMSDCPHMFNWNVLKWSH
jgi:hypothetical protein